jgi:hypothetical protein
MRSVQRNRFSTPLGRDQAKAAALRAEFAAVDALFHLPGFDPPARFAPLLHPAQHEASGQQQRNPKDCGKREDNFAGCYRLDRPRIGRSRNLRNYWQSRKFMPMSNQVVRHRKPTPRSGVQEALRC